MPREIIKRFEVPYLQVLDEEGRCDEALMPDLAGENIKELYEYMVLVRTFDEKAVKLQRMGRIGTYAPVLGQEASQIGSAYALEDEDWMFPSYRENGSYIVRGVPMAMVLRYWAGDERGCQMPEGLNNFTVAIPVGTQVLHAVGAAWAFKMRKEKKAALVYFGDGATSKGDFHEGMNFAGVFRVPVVFLCQNNQWAISVPITRQTAAETLAQKAIAYGFDGIRVDGNDVFAVYKSTKDALEKARSGGGPTFIECYTYRMGDHTTADDASRYRSQEEVEAWRVKDPIERLRRYMVGRGLWTEEYGKKIQGEAEERVRKAVEEMEATPEPEMEDIFRYTFEKMPQHLEEELQELKEALREGRK